MPQSAGLLDRNDLLTAATAATAIHCASGVLNAHFVIVAQGGGGKEGEAEEFIAYILSKLLAGRDGAEAVGGDEHFNLCKHLEDDGYANGELELVVALIGACDTDCADHAL